MLFDENNLEQALTPCDDEPDFKYDRLSRIKDEGIALARSRLPALKEIFGQEIEEVFYIWLNFIESLSGKYIFVETCELVMMSEKSSIYKKEAKNCIRAFSESLIIERGFLFKKKQASPKWTILFGQAEISDVSKLPEAVKLCGYSWESKVPWE
ncbi:MAG TPA: hypothetical protein ENJ08_12720 [Gammaproteobacteria bacterium]|nr:hypothetical protein [Gammaproteobacteria bacterium]